MACEKIICSCSLCPFLGEESCPHLHDNEEKYWIYIQNERTSELIVCLKSNNLTKIKQKLIELQKQEKWTKSFLHEIKNSLSYVIIYITNGDCNWMTSIKLALSVEEHKFYSYNPYDNSINLWNDKLIFKES